MKNIFKLFYVISISIIFASCKKSPQPQMPAMSQPEHFSFEMSSPLSERIKPMPESLLRLYRQMDNRSDYAAYKLSAVDKRLVLEYISLLPPIYQKVFRENCVGIYFIENFIGNGIASWVAGRDNKVYFHITLNPASLKDTLSKTLTERDRSCFSPAPGLSINIDAGTKYKGFAYALFHEATHAVDYVKRITPFVEKNLPEKYWPKKNTKGNIFFNFWKDYAIPRPGRGFEGRDKITFYGLDNGPKLKMKEAPVFYKGLARSPFISLYGSKNWAEDLAEMATFQMITAKLCQPYVVTLSGFAKEDIIYEPMSSNRGKRATEIMKILEAIPVGAEK
jgi:hypothetical protein